MTTEIKPVVEQIDSPYFGEEDVLAIQSNLNEEGYINPYLEEEEPLRDPVFLAKALDALVDSIIAGIIEYPDDMLFGVCDGNFSSEFQRAIRAIQARGMTKEELRAMR